MNLLRKSPCFAALLLVVSTLVFGATSCKSADRMLRISPLMGESTRERVNLWPLAYHDRGATSILWPIFDIDQNGFALRPLVAKEGTSTSVLFPLAAYDSRTKTGWLVPAYKFENNFGLFPIANFGSASWILPFWWNKGPTGQIENGGLFPLALFGDFNYVGPVWWASEKDSFGVFPLFAAGELNHFGPIWWDSEPRGESSAGLFPLAWYGNEGKRFGLLPFYSHTLTDDSARRWYLMGLGHSYRKPDLKESWLFPLYYLRKTPKEEDRALFPFFWKRTRGDDSHVFTLLGDRSVDPNGSGLNLYPFWWSNENEAEERAMRMLLPLFYYEREGDSRTLLSPLGGYGWTGSGDSRYVNLLGPLYHQSQSLDGTEERTAFLWPLFERHRTPEVTTTRALPFWSHRETPEFSESFYALGLGHHRESEEGSASRLWPFYSHYDTYNEPDVLYALTLYGARDHGDLTRRWLFPFYLSTTTEDSTDLDYLVGLGNYRRSPEGKSWRFWPFVSKSEGFAQPDPLHHLTLVGSAKWEGGESHHFGGPFLYIKEKIETELEERESTGLLTFFWKERHKLRGLHIPSSTGASQENRTKLRSSSLVLDIFVNRDETFHVWKDDVLTREEARLLATFSPSYEGPDVVPESKAKARAVLEERGVAVKGSDDEALLQALSEFTEANSEVVEREQIRIPLLYGYKRTNEQKEWYGPLWLVNSYSDETVSKTNVLYYGYRSKTEGTKTTRDIFPFITWDSDEEETDVSFLWRFFRYHRKGEERGGHILFIPWGDQ